MNKLILGTMLAVGLCYAEVDYNKAMGHLGGNCKFHNEISTNDKYFSCDSGFIVFNFTDREILLSFETISDEGRKVEIHLLFNRAWTKNGKQIHKEKSTIFIVEDEFGATVNTGSGRWSGRGGDFYERFKEDVYYSK